MRLSRNLVPSCGTISRCLPRIAAFPSSPAPRHSIHPLLRPSSFSTHVQPPLRKKITTVDIQRLFASRIPISMVTAYTYPSAVHVDLAGIDVLLVGDSLGMVELGYETTLPVTVDDMLHHAKAVSRGAEHPLLVVDLPFGSYEGDVRDAHHNAVRFLKEAGMDAVKLEGGRQRAATVRHLVDSGIAVMGHIGLTPQQISTLGGFRAQGKTQHAAALLLLDALALQHAGAFAIVIECTPPSIPLLIQPHLSVPLIGIGAGPHCSGQVLVYHDMLGFYQHAHHAKVVPKFCKRYSNVGEQVQRGLEEYAKEVKDRVFPGMEYSPYRMTNGEDDDGLKELMDGVARRWKDGDSSGGLTADKMTAGKGGVARAQSDERHAESRRESDGDSDGVVKVY